MFVVVNNKDNVLLKAGYKLKKQKPDGYFVSLVGMDWLKKVCATSRMNLTLKAANPFYALVHYHLLPNRKALKVSDRGTQPTQPSGVRIGPGSSPQRSSSRPSGPAISWSKAATAEAVDTLPDQKPLDAAPPPAVFLLDARTPRTAPVDRPKDH